MKFLIILGLVLVMVLSVVGFSTVEISAPTPLTYETSTLVNISGGINISAFPYLQGDIGTNKSNFTDAVINVTILTKTTSAGTYSILASSLPLTINATNRSPDVFWNFSATLSEGRNYIQLNFTNVSRAADGSYGGALTAERIVQVDSESDKITLMSGSINFSTNGNITSAGWLEGRNISIQSPDKTYWFCGVNDTGQFGCLPQ